MEDQGSMFPSNCNQSIPLSMQQKLYQVLLQDLDMLHPHHMMMCSGIVVRIPIDTNHYRFELKFLTERFIYPAYLEYFRALAYVTGPHN